MWPLFLQKARVVSSLVSLRLNSRGQRQKLQDHLRFRHQNLYTISATFFWLKQVTRLVKIQRVGESFLMGGKAKITGICIERWEELSWSSLQIISYMLSSVFFILLSLHALVWIFFWAIFQSLILSSTASNTLLNSSIDLFLVIVFSVLEFVSSLVSSFPTKFLSLISLDTLRIVNFKILVWKIHYINSLQVCLKLTSISLDFQSCNLICLLTLKRLFDDSIWKIKKNNLRFWMLLNVLLSGG